VRRPLLTLLTGASALAIVLSERRYPLRRPTQAEPRRTARNVTLGALALVTVQALENPVVQPLASCVERRRMGLAQRLPAPAWARDALAFLLLDYTIYAWHILTHRVPALWRFHLVHHLDMDLDSTTALRFHAADMAISVPYRAAQVALLGASPRALRLWRAFFFVSVLFHHSSLRLPFRLERILSRVLTTPRMHGIHHSSVRSQAETNWSSGLSLWDHLHGTFQLDVPQDSLRIGVPAYRDPAELAVVPSLLMPFLPERPAWGESPGACACRRNPDAGGAPAT